MIEQMYEFGDQDPNNWEFRLLGYSEKFKYRVTEVNLPTHTIESQNKESTGEKYFTGVSHISEVTLTFTETDNMDISSFFHTWRNSIYDPNKRVFRKGNKKKHGIIQFNKALPRKIQGAIENLPETNTPAFLKNTINQTGVGQGSTVGAGSRPIMIAWLKGLLPKSFSEFSLNYNNDGPMNISVTFQIDSVQYVFLNIGANELSQLSGLRDIIPADLLSSIPGSSYVSSALNTGIV